MRLLCLVWENAVHWLWRAELQHNADKKIERNRTQSSRNYFSPLEEPTKERREAGAPRSLMRQGLKRTLSARFGAADINKAKMTVVSEGEGEGTVNVAQGDNKKKAVLSASGGMLFFMGSGDKLRSDEDNTPSGLSVVNSGGGCGAVKEGVAKTRKGENIVVKEGEDGPLSSPDGMYSSAGSVRGGEMAEGSVPLEGSASLSDLPDNHSAGVFTRRRSSSDSSALTGLGLLDQNHKKKKKKHGSGKRSVPLSPTDSSSSSAEEDNHNSKPKHKSHTHHKKNSKTNEKNTPRKKKKHDGKGRRASADIKALSELTPTNCSWMDFEDEDQMVGFENLLKGTSSTSDASVLKGKKKDKKETKPRSRTNSNAEDNSASIVALPRPPSRNKVTLEIVEEDKAVKFEEEGRALTPKKKPENRVRDAPVLPKVPSLPLAEPPGGEPVVSPRSKSARERLLMRTLSWTDEGGKEVHHSSSSASSTPKQARKEKKKERKEEKRYNSSGGESEGDATMSPVVSARKKFRTKSNDWKRKVGKEGGLALPGLESIPELSWVDYEDESQMMEFETQLKGGDGADGADSASCPPSKTTTPTPERKKLSSSGGMLLIGLPSGGSGGSGKNNPSPGSKAVDDKKLRNIGLSLLQLRGRSKTEDGVDSKAQLSWADYEDESQMMEFEQVLKAPGESTPQSTTPTTTPTSTPTKRREGLTLKPKTLTDLSKALVRPRRQSDATEGLLSPRVCLHLNLGPTPIAIVAQEFKRTKGIP